MLYSQLKIFFQKVSITKPASSRNSSIEAFVVCQNYSPPEGYIPQMINPLAEVQIILSETESPVNRLIIPFVVCGDLRGYDSDMSYSLLVSLKRVTLYLIVKGTQSTINSEVAAYFLSKIFFFDK